MRHKQTITIFVSGAKRLKEHRMRLKVLANDLNGEYRKKGDDVIINMYSYMNLGDNQKEYDNFIKHKADIVFFLIEDTMGEKTRDEFLLASETYKKDGFPKIFVFLKEFHSHTPEIVEIENLINAHSKSYYVEYSNIEDLVAKVKERLQQDIEERLKNVKEPPSRILRKFKYWAISSTMAFFLLLGYGLIQLYMSSHDVILLFAGGGSAVNCLKNTNKEIGDVYSYDNSIAIGLPTKAAWALVSAEVLHHHAFKGERVQTPFYPVCLSAKKAKESDFLQLCDKDQFLGKGSVLSLSIGEDRLMVYVKSSMENKYVSGKDSITVNELSEMIKLVMKQGGIIFTTQEGSGTLLSYREQLQAKGVYLTKDSLGNNLQWYSQQTPSSKIRRGEQPYLIMGSEFYVSKEVFEEGDCRGLILVDDNNEAIKKPIYLYFAGYYHNPEGNSFWIPDEMVVFLKKINPQFDKIIKKNLLPRKNEMVIVSLDDYLSQE